MSSYDGVTIESLASNATGYVAPAIQCLANAIAGTAAEQRYLEVKDVAVSTSTDADADAGEEAPDYTNHTCTAVDHDTGLVYKIARSDDSPYTYTATVVGVVASSDFSQGMFVPRTIVFDVNAQMEQDSVSQNTISRSARVTTFDNITFTRYRSGNGEVSYGSNTWFYAPWIETFNNSAFGSSVQTVNAVPFSRIELPRCRVFSSSALSESNTAAYLFISISNIQLIDLSSLTRVDIDYASTYRVYSIIKTSQSSNVTIEEMRIGVGVYSFNPSSNIESLLGINMFNIDSTSTSYTVTVNNLRYISNEIGSTCYHSKETYGSSSNYSYLRANTVDACVAVGTSVVNVYIPRIVVTTSRAGTDQFATFALNMWRQITFDGSSPTTALTPSNVYII